MGRSGPTHRLDPLRRKPRDLTVDALVSATALGLHPPIVVLTSDPADLARLLAGSDVQVAPL